MLTYVDIRGQIRKFSYEHRVNLFHPAPTQRHSYATTSVGMHY